GPPGEKNSHLTYYSNGFRLNAFPLQLTTIQMVKRRE
ncbi:adenylate kinase, partial [Enterobacter cloacae complex sp. 742-ADZ3-9B]